MRRLWTFLVDLVDGVLAATLYGGQGGMTYTTYGLEAENADKLRAWATGGETEGARDEPETNVVPIDERIRRFREATSDPREV